MQQSPDSVAPAAGARLSTGARLGVTFTSILGLFAVALLVVLHAMSQLARVDRDAERLARAKDSSHRVAALIREQYIHQAHTIIEWNRSHLAHYKDVAALTRKATDQLAAFASNDEERALVGEIARLVRANDEDFLAITLPAIDRGEHDEVTKLHAETEKLVGRVAKLVKELNGRFEARSEAARASADRQRFRVRLTTIACFGCATIVAAIMGILTTRSIARRVSALRAGARRIGDGDLDQRVGLEGRDELADLGRSIDEMAERLSRHQDELVRSHKLATIGRLCAGVAHEINGPLGIILGYASVIRKEGVDDEALGAIEQEARQCQRIVQGLLDMSRHDLAPFDCVDLALLANEGVERLRASGKLGGRRVQVRSLSATVRAFGNEAKLGQVVLNLLTNAAEATEDGGHITIEITERNGQVMLIVDDDGHGLAAAEQEHLFEPFFTTKAQGTGLGLAISRAIIDAHRGEITLAPSLCGGTRVEVRLQRPTGEVHA